MRISSSVRIPVSLVGVAPQVILAFIVFDQILKERQLGGVQITSGREGRHSDASLHYDGKALDGEPERMSWESVPEVDRVLIIGELRRKLDVARTREFDVVDELTHVHIEWQPKYRAS